VDSAVRNPDRVRERFAPQFAGWDSVGGDTNTVQYTNLVPDATYMFVVVAFDEAGAYSPIMSMSHNMLRFRVGYAGLLGPTITVFNEFFNYTWRGGFCPTCDPVFIEVPANNRITFNWFADPEAGSDIRCYRWALDIPDVFDDTPRKDEVRDLSRWSSCQLGNTSVTLGPFEGSVPPDPPEEHRFYVECRDNIGLRSLAVIRFQVVRASMDDPRSILVVKDTRFQPDNRDPNTGCTLPQPASVSWPSQAELDTFLFARGNVPWRCTPSGTMSSPGLFAAYPVDTLGTRSLFRNLTVPLSTLSRYRHVVWIVDPAAAGIDDEGFSFNLPATSLRYMTAPGRFNTLGAHVKMGGKVWLMGGGGGFASTKEWDVGGNTEGTGFSESLGELRPGRLMYDLARWQSEFYVRSVLFDLRRFTGRHEFRPGDPPYTAYLDELPPRIDPKSTATDPMPPLRTRPSSFYKTVATLEFLTAENHVVENTSEDPEHPNEVSALDTLYADGGPSFGGDHRRVTMTYYHGPTVPQGFLFSGFDVWTYRRDHCQAIVDFVMRRIWSIPKAPLVARR
jgi:hypothetical protein